MKTDREKLYASHGTGSFSFDQFKSIGDNVIFENGVMVFHPENISIGSNVYIGHGAILKGYYKNEMIIGSNSWIGSGCFFHSGGGILIGEAVGIGPRVIILTSAHMDQDLSIPVLYHEIETSSVTIMSGSDLGTGSIILPGVTVGIGAIVGAGSIVTKDVEPYHIVAGNPARVLRKRGAR